MKITRVITKMAAGSNSSVWQDLLLLSRQNEFSDLPSLRKDSAERRQIIRSTWANDSHYLPRKVQHVFVLGM